MAYDLELWFIRGILFVGIAPELGPKLAMIRKMVGYICLPIVLPIMFVLL